MAGTYDLIATSTFSAVSSRDFTSIPSTYTDLVIQAHIFSDSGGDIYIRFNGNASNYYQLGGGITSSGFRSFTFAGSEFRVIGLVNSIQQSANPAFLEFVMPEYANSSYTKNGVMNIAYIANTSTNLANTQFMATQWRNTAAINRVEFLTGGGNFSGQINIYGITAGNA